MLIQISEMKADIQNVKDETKQISEMKTDIQKMKNEIREISLTLENETNRNIKIIAEGHLDLSRKLDKALTVENEKEMALIRINMMENEIRRIGKKAFETAMKNDVLPVTEYIVFLLSDYFTIRLSPVICSGFSSPIRSSIVGQRSQSLPFLTLTSPAPTRIIGTGLVV